MMLDLRQVFSPTSFVKTHKEMVASLGETRRPVALIVKGKSALLIQDGDSYQELMDRLVDTRLVATDGEPQEKSGSSSSKN